MGKEVKLKASDGFALTGYLAEPAGKPVGGVVVVQEIFGVNQHIRSVTDLFAGEGFLALAPAIFDRVESNVQLGFDPESSKKGMELMGRLNMDNVVKDVEAALAYLEQQTGKAAAVVGYCYGGTVAWLSATRLAPAAAVGYYGGNIIAFNGEQPKAPVMLHFGLQDDHIPQTDVDKIQSAHPEVQIFRYQAGHAFNNDMRVTYVPEAAKEALARTLPFLRQHI